MEEKVRLNKEDGSMNKIMKQKQAQEWVLIFSSVWGELKPMVWAKNLKKSLPCSLPVEAVFQLLMRFQTEESSAELYMAS